MPAMTRRRVLMHLIPGKAQAVIGMRRAGKTMFLHQVMADRLAAGMAREWMVYLNFEDERLAGLSTSDLTWLLEEYYREQPAARGAARVLWCLDRTSGGCVPRAGPVDGGGFGTPAHGQSAKILACGPCTHPAA